MSVAVARRPAAWADHLAASLRLLGSRTVTLSTVELQKIRSDRTELFTRMVQPVLWLLVFGQIFSRIRAIPTGDLSYLAYLTPGILAQSALFVSIFYGIQIIWDRDSGILTKVMVTPTPRAAIVLAKAFAAGVRGLAPVVVLVPAAILLGVSITPNPLKLVLAALALLLSAGFFACLSMVIAGIAQTRDRLMGIGQLMTMPLFFASNALYPIAIMPGWLRVLSEINPLTYLVNALRGLLVGAPATLWVDFSVLTSAFVVAVACAAPLLGKLVR